MNKSFNNGVYQKVSGVEREVFLHTRSRLKFAFWAFFAVYMIYSARLVELSFFNIGDEPQIERLSFESGLQKDAVSFGRGDIKDRNDILVATNLPVQSLYVDPSMVVHSDYLVERLSAILPDVSRDRLQSSLEAKGRFRWLKRGVTPEQQALIMEIGDPALSFVKEYRRFYPHSHLMAHLMGKVNLDGEGLGGVEGRFDEVLKKGYEDIDLSIDVRIQHAVRQVLLKTKARFDAKGAAAIVADVKSGEILAYVSLPDFEPNQRKVIRNNAMFNRVEKGVYELGSIFKIYSTAAYIERYPNIQKKLFDAKEPLQRGRFTIEDFHPEKKRMTVADIFRVSSNIGTALMAEKIGGDDLQEFYRELGLMERISGHGLYSSVPQTPRPWRDISTVTTSYGHGISVTPLHAVQAFLPIVSDGVKRPLSLIRQTSTEGDHNNGDAFAYRVLSKDGVHMMRALMRLSVSHGTGRAADVEGYFVGGKTGTAEKLVNGQYDDEKKISSFLGAFPMHDPQYAILVMVDEPKGRGDTYGFATGGWVAAPASRAIIERMIAILSLPPYSANEVSGLEKTTESLLRFSRLDEEDTQKNKDNETPINKRVLVEFEE